MRQATKRMAATERERNARRKLLDFWPFTKKKKKKKKKMKKPKHKTREQQQPVAIARIETTGNHGGGSFSNYEGGNEFSCLDDDFDFGFYDAFRLRRAKGGKEMRDEREGDVEEKRSGGSSGKSGKASSNLFRARRGLRGRNAAAEVKAVEMSE